MEEEDTKTDVTKMKLLRCMDWLQNQNSLEPQKSSLQNKNDIQFIIQTNTDRKNFLLASADDEATVPDGVGETTLEPKAVALHKLRFTDLHMECEWQSCRLSFSEYNEYEKHICAHSADVHVINKDNISEYVCLWDVCGQKTTDFKEIVRHLSYHAYHGKLLAIGFNGRATLKLARCRKASGKRNLVPMLIKDHICMWAGCEEKFHSMQMFLEHVKVHTNYAENLVCSWAGCGSKFPRKILLTMHVRSHTGERLIACYHCGQHFASNRKLCDHLRRQNVYPSSPYVCAMCGVRCATEYLLNEHVRQHVSTYACSLCDMSCVSPAALAHHLRYRHLAAGDTRTHACPHCPYKAVTKWDLQKHIPRHKMKRDHSDEENSDAEVKKKKGAAKNYACHICPDKNTKIFSRGTRLTSHLVKVHGAQWPDGHSRFRYQISDDGFYRLTTTRYESLEVSKKIVDGYSDPKSSLTNSYKFKLKKTADATETTPRRYEIVLKDGDDDAKVKTKSDDNPVEITMCDVDEDGNIISSEIIKDVVYG